MKMRHSPLAKTPPANLPVIPGVTAPLTNGSRSSPDKATSEMLLGSDTPQKLQTVKGTFAFDILVLVLAASPLYAF
jgi:hypothetical protein